MSELYFAYGSNLKASRMRERVPSAVDIGIAMLAGMEFRFDKLGRDGSGKANLAGAPTSRIWGFVYRIDRSDWTRLDGFEPGYSRIAVDVVGPSDRAHAVQTYLADEPVDGLVALPDYATLIIEGAREHGLPAHYVDALRELWR